MKKLLALLLCMVMLLALVACGSSEKGGDNGDDKGGEQAAESYEFDVGEFKVTVPGGWKEFPLTDISGEGNDPNSIDIYKGDSMFGGFPYIRIDYYGPSTTMMALMPELYENVEEIAEFELGGYTWSGFKCTSFDMPLINLQTAAGDHEFQLALWYEQDNGTISLEDADVKALIESLTPNA